MATDWNATIDDMYDDLLEAQKKQLTVQRDQKAAAYNKQLADAAGTYQDARNQAYVSHAQDENTRKETMANMGLSGAGGTSRQQQHKNADTLLDTMSDVSRQQQDYTDNINLALADLDTALNADTSNLTSQINEQKNSAQMAADQWQKNFDLSQRQFDQSLADNTFSQAYNLYMSKLITKKQFEAMTGIDVK